MIGRLAIIVVCAVAGFGAGRALSPAKPAGASSAPTCQDAETMPRAAAWSSVPAPDPANEVVERGSPRYDATIAGRLRGVSTSELFEDEQRDPSFAEPRERFLRRRYAELVRSVLPTVEITDVECRTNTCRLEALVPAGDIELADAAVGFVPIGDRLETEIMAQPDGTRLLLVHVAYARDHLDQRDYEAWFEPLWALRWEDARARYLRETAPTADEAPR